MKKFQLLLPICLALCAGCNSTYDQNKAAKLSNGNYTTGVDSLSLEGTPDVILHQKPYVKPIIEPVVVEPKFYEDGAYRLYPETGVVEFRFVKGLLKPQVVELLFHHYLIDSEDDIQWAASTNFMWPNSHTISGNSLDHVINAVLSPYKLVANFKGNGSVIIQKL